MNDFGIIIPRLVRSAAPIGDVPADVLPEWFDAFLTNVCEIPDRNSPEDEPDAIVATLEELKSCALNAIESCAAPIGDVPTDTKRLDFYEENLESDRARNGTVSVWLNRGWGDEFTGPSMREAIDAAILGQNPACAGIGEPESAAPIGDVQLSDAQIEEIAEQHWSSCRPFEVTWIREFERDDLLDFARSIVRALSAPRERQEPAGVAVFAPKVGEMWFVRFPGAIALSRCEVREARLLTITLATGGNYHETTYKRSDVEFVDKCALSSHAPESQGGGK